MFKLLLKFINNYQWKSLNWKKIGSFNVDRDFCVINPQCIEIGDNFYAERFLKLQAWTHYNKKTFSPNISIGENVSIMDNCQISCCGIISIGSGCLFGPNVFITDNFHGNPRKNEFALPPIERDLYLKGNVYIGDNVWLGRNVCVLPGVRIGDGAIVGANSVVTKDIPSNSVAVGTPCKIIKQ